MAAISANTARRGGGTWGGSERMKVGEKRDEEKKVKRKEMKSKEEEEARKEERRNATMERG